MRLTIRHETAYDFDRAPAFGLQQLRLTPKSHVNQTVHDWTLTIDGGRRQLGFDDSHRNRVDLISFDAGVTRVSVLCEGTVEVTDTAGVVGAHGGYMPLWIFDRQTALTRPGPLARRIAQSVAAAGGPLQQMHALCDAVADVIDWQPGSSAVTGTGEEALAAGTGVCQDMAHAFIAAARHLGRPARYVSGYLLTEGETRAGDATHAWAEAHVPDLGWVGFDPANRMCPDGRYVRVATGLDYAEAAPVSGLRLGPGGESLTVRVEVQAQ